MDVIKRVKEENGNYFLGEEPILQNSSISFKGKNNILYCEKDVKLVDSKIVFNGNESVVFLGMNRNEYRINISVFNHQVCFWGRNNYINGVVNVVLSEQKHVFIGDDNLFSFGIWIRNADPHLIYDINTKERTNYSKSIFIGDHVWLGQSSMILKGAQIGSGSIVSAMSVVPDVRIPSNECWGGVSAKPLKTGIFWEGSCVHRWTNKETEQRMRYESDAYIFSKNQNNNTNYDVIDNRMSCAESANEKLNFLIQLREIEEKNKFAIVP